MGIMPVCECSMCTRDLGKDVGQALWCIRHDLLGGLSDVLAGAGVLHQRSGNKLRLETQRRLVAGEPGKLPQEFNDMDHCACESSISKWDRNGNLGKY